MIELKRASRRMRRLVERIEAYARAREDVFYASERGHPGDDEQAADDVDRTTAALERSLARLDRDLARAERPVEFRV
jgi:hypothetical protein